MIHVDGDARPALGLTVEIILSNPSFGTGLPASHHVWEQRGPHCFTCVGQAEVSRPKRGQPWVVMVPLSMDGATPTAWGLMPAGTGHEIRQFPSAKDAMAEAERYLSIFHQYHQPHDNTELDLAEGNNRVAGSQLPIPGQSVKAP